MTPMLGEIGACVLAVLMTIGAVGVTRAEPPQSPPTQQQLVEIAEWLVKTQGLVGPVDELPHVIVTSKDTLARIRYGALLPAAPMAVPGQGGSMPVRGEHT